MISIQNISGMSPLFIANSGSLLFPSETKRLNNLDFIRFALAISVLYCHCYVMYYGTEDTVEPLWVASGKQLSIGTVAVNFFFVISGFLILQSWNNSKGLWDYLRKRILRIYPGFIIASLLCLLVFAPLGTADWYMPYGYWKLYYENIKIPQVLISMLELSEPTVPWTLNNAPVYGTINGALWTIRYEFFCYLFIPLAGLAGLYKKKYFILILFLFAFISLLTQHYANIFLFNWKEYILLGKPDFFPRFFTYFIAGMCFYTYKDEIPRSRILLAFSFLIVAASAFIFKGLVITQVLFGTYILFYLAFTSTVSFQNFASNGDLSYGVYIYAWPVQQLMILYLEKYMNLSLLFILTLTVTLIFAYLSWHFIEKPFLNLKLRNNSISVNNKTLILKSVKDEI
jgi:peptidoglycan/LPS O-acetylase OafA/YrhL